MAVIEQEFELVPVSEIQAHPDNPRRGDTKAIRASIRANGFYGSCVVQRSSGNICVGNHRYAAAVEEGLEEIPVTWVEIDDEAAKKMLLVDNRSSDFGVYDDQELANILNALDTDFDGTGYDTAFLDDLVARLESNEIDLDNVDIGKTPEERLESWENSGVRSIVLPFDLETYERVREQFAAVRKQLGVESNSEVVESLLGEVETVEED